MNYRNWVPVIPVAMLKANGWGMFLFNHAPSVFRINPRHIRRAP